MSGRKYNEASTLQGVRDLVFTMKRVWDAYLMSRRLGTKR